MRRYFILAPVCVLLGVITTVAAAWVFALLPDPSWPDERSHGLLLWDADQSVWMIYVMAKSGSTNLFSSKLQRSGRDFLQSYSSGLRMAEITLDEIPPWSRFHSSPTTEELKSFCDVWHEHAYGLPARCLLFRNENDPQIRNGAGALLNKPRPGRTTDVITLTPSTPLIRRWDYLPTGVIVSGFAINAGVYSLMWGACLIAPGFSRRLIRLKRGCCTRCGYDLRGLESAHPHCPECGNPSERSTI